MKNTISVLMLFVGVTLFSQIKVSDTKKAETIGSFKQGGVLYFELNKSDDEMSILYKDMKFTKINEYKSFYFSVEDLDPLYSLFTDFSEKEKGDSKTVDLPNGDQLVFNYKKTMGKMYAQVFHHSKGVTGLLRWMTPKQVNKTFGKNN